MRNYALLIMILASFMINFAAAEKPAYALFDSSGAKVDYEDLLAAASKADIVFFGEMHNDPIGHWLQLELTKDLYDSVGDRLILGAEMFESDNQLIIDEYFADLISQSNFEKECRLWGNYETDYKPILEFAKLNEIPLIATNVPRRYASTVAKQGLDKLDELPKEAKNYIAPLNVKYDLELGCYAKMDAMFGNHGGADKAENFKKAQMIKDATMAHFILENYDKKSVFLHFNGAFHTDDYEGIVWFVRQEKPKLKILTISTSTRQNIDSLEETKLGSADFILAVPISMTKTH